MARRQDRPRRPDATGRVHKAPPFVMLSKEMVESAAYASLDLTARALLWELRHLFNGSNNGSIYLGARSATARLGLADFRPVQRAFDALQDRGFITLAKQAHFAVKSSEGSRARCWRLTWESWPECPVKARRVPTHEWRAYRAPGKTKDSRRADRRLKALADFRKSNAAGQFPVVESTTTEAQMAQERMDRVEENTTRKTRNDAKPPFVVVGDFTTHIDDTMGRACSSWWQCQLEGQIRGQILALNWLTKNQPNFAQAA